MKVMISLATRIVRDFDTYKMLPEERTLVGCDEIGFRVVSFRVVLT